jgi:hypothetical protein
LSSGDRLINHWEGLEKVDQFIGGLELSAFLDAFYYLNHPGIVWSGQTYLLTQSDNLPIEVVNFRRPAPAYALQSGAERIARSHRQP